MMPDNNPFLEGYKSAILGNDVCPYQSGTAEYARWCQGYGGEPIAKAAAPVKKSGCHLALTAEGRRPFVEGYKSAILATRFGHNTVCPYEDGSPEYERWWKGFRGPVAIAAARKPVTIPVLEGRRPFVEGYKSQILAIRFGKKSDCPYDEGSTEYERWTKGFRGQMASKAMADMAARW
jgi:ribosome modulation factor